MARKGTSGSVCCTSSAIFYIVGVGVEVGVFEVSVKAPLVRMEVMGRGELVSQLGHMTATLTRSCFLV